MDFKMAERKWRQGGELTADELDEILNAFDKELDIHICAEDDAKGQVERLEDELSEVKSSLSAAEERESKLVGNLEDRDATIAQLEDAICDLRNQYE